MNVCARLICLLLFAPIATFGQLIVRVSKPKLAGSKADIKIQLQNNFSGKIESARAVLFVVDGDGKVIGQSSKWVIGGTPDLPGLPPQQTNTFHFVIPTQTLATTNFSTKLIFNRVVLEGGKLADLPKAVTIQQSDR